MALIEVRGLGKQFGGRRVLEGVNLDVHAGEIKVVMGPSGCGKSTLLRLLNRLEDADAGSIVVDGRAVTGGDVDVRALRRRIGFVFQQFALYRHLTVRENVTLALRKLGGLGRAQADERARHELARLELLGHEDQYPAQLSGGQKQRAAIARALAMDPAVLLLDEPTSALDPVLTREVGALLSRLNGEGVTMLCVTHDLTLARALSAPVVFLHDGRVCAEDRVEQLVARDEPVLREFFGQSGRRDAGL